MQELVTRSSSSMGIPPHRTFGATSSSFEGLGRLIACDLIGRGRSDKLPDSGLNVQLPRTEGLSVALWEQRNLGDKVIVVLHDWGSL